MILNMPRIDKYRGTLTIDLEGEDLAEILGRLQTILKLCRKKGMISGQVNCFREATTNEGTQEQPASPPPKLVPFGEGVPIDMVDQLLDSLEEE